MKIIFLRRIICFIFIILLLCPGNLYSGANQNNNISIFPLDFSHNPNINITNPEDYIGWIRIFVVEPVSRWLDDQGNNYHYGFLDFALDSILILPDGSRSYTSFDWDASLSGFGNISGSNIMVVATMFNNTPHQSYSFPPSYNPFTAYYSDACAAVVSGESDSNKTASGFTHTVLVEDGSSTGCSSCSITSNMLNSIKNTGDYPFQFISLIRNANEKARVRVEDFYNIYGTPTCWADGGDEVVLGGQTDEQLYRDMIESCGQREVADLGLIVGMDWIGNAKIHVEIAVSHGTPVNTPPTPFGTPTGENQPLPETNYEYNFTGNDNEADWLYYKVNWGNGEELDWFGPFESGVPMELVYSWPNTGTYNISFKCKGPWKFESDWSPPLIVEVTNSCCQIRGDVAFPNDGNVLVNDLVFLVNHLFKGGPTPACEDHGDCANPIDGNIFVNDLVYLVNYIFKGGSPPPEC
ncbi:MAG: hypothetical protein ABIJ12_08205 [bacterium]